MNSANKLFVRLILANFIFTFFATSIFASDFTSANKTQFVIWPQIVFAQGADFANFDYTIQQNRDRVRQMLLQEFADVTIPMVMSGADATSLAPIMAKILLTFDSMHAKHIQDAYKGVSSSLEQIFKASFEAQFKKYAINENSRRVIFSSDDSLVAAVSTAQQNNQNISNADALKAMNKIDYVLFGLVSIASPSSVTITLNLINYRSGEARSFMATGEIQLAIQNLAEQLFTFFQSNQYDAWVNPQPNLKWIRPAPAMPRALPASVQAICQSQGARIPFARELILAAAGSQFHAGGIPPLNNNDVYLVADRQRLNTQYFYFTNQDTAGGGPIRTSAGFANANQMAVSYWCVQGNVSDDIRYIENLYRIYRQFNDEVVTKAVQYLLFQLNDYGANPRSMYDFPDVDTAKAALRAHGVLL